MKKLTTIKRAAALLLCALTLCVPLLGMAAPAMADASPAAYSGHSAKKPSAPGTR